MKNRWSLSLLVFLLGLVACARFVQTMDGSYYETIEPTTQSTYGAVVFSGNVNGETQPCGCRKFPLGGLEQAAGHFHQLQAELPFIYVDTGDTFFPSTQIPDSMKASVTYTAESLVKAMEQLNLKLFVPGDQDFALGWQWLAELSQRAKFQFLISNLKPETGMKAQKSASFNIAGRSVHFIGVIWPSLLQGNFSHYFTDPGQAIKETLSDLSPSSDDIVILLSHSGMDNDKQLVAQFPRINWVMGSHSQSYTTSPQSEGNTQLVQVLSRNHYIGKLKFPLGGRSQAGEEFSLLETREEMSQVVTPNPFTAFMQNYRQELKDIQQKEQSALATDLPSAGRIPTVVSCMDCHEKQTSFWMGTAHAISWQTLVKKGSQFDGQCIGCHSVGFQQAGGFVSGQTITVFAQANDEHQKKYLEAIQKSLSKINSVRNTPTVERRKMASHWQETNRQFGVTHDYANVQCLNCHDKTNDHPYDGSTTQVKVDTHKCLQCHTADQSPEWYPINPQSMQAKVKQVACPAK